MGEDEIEGPDPGRVGAIFLGWLKRNGGAKHLTTCERKMRHLGLDLGPSVSEWGQERISVVPGRGDKVVWLKDTRWADLWASLHDVEVPHHSQSLKSKEKLR